MRDRPDGATLAALAREARARQEERELVARALAIADRESLSGAAPLDECRAALAVLYGDGDVVSLLRRFAAEIRAGRFDRPGVGRDQALRLLWTITVRKLRESNPEYLASAG
jgi:hypothetical protein